MDLSEGAPPAAAQQRHQRRPTSSAVCRRWLRLARRAARDRDAVVLDGGHRRRCRLRARSCHHALRGHVRAGHQHGRPVGQHVVRRPRREALLGWLEAPGGLALTARKALHFTQSSPSARTRSVCRRSALCRRRGGGAPRSSRTASAGRGNGAAGSRRARRVARPGGGDGLEGRRRHHDRRVGRCARKARRELEGGPRQAGAPARGRRAGDARARARRRRPRARAARTRCGCTISAASCRCGSSACATSRGARALRCITGEEGMSYRALFHRLLPPSPRLPSNVSALQRGGCRSDTLRLAQ